MNITSGEESKTTCVVTEERHCSNIQISELKFLSGDHCKIRNAKKVELIINEFMNGGTDRLQVVSDFDYTITKQRTADGKQVLSSFGIFNACSTLPKTFIEESNKLYRKYRPIEVDPNIPIPDKVKHMIDWWSKSGELLVGFEFDESEIDEIAGRYKDSLRDNAHELFEILNQLNIPVLVFSAGLGNSVISVLRQANVLYPNVKVISNFLQYKDGMVNGFQTPLIHTYNKNETVLKGSEYYDLVHNRDHIIVMGDSLGDAGMATGVPSTSHTLKIGFLFDHIEENLEKYMETFDIVLIDDQTMDVPISLLKLIQDHKKSKSNQN